MHLPVKVLFVDDDVERTTLFVREILPKGVESMSIAFAREAGDACYRIQNQGPFDIAFLDWYLGTPPIEIGSKRYDTTGTKIAEFITKHPSLVKKVVVHAWNIGQRDKMLKILREGGVPATGFAFGMGLKPIMEEVVNEKRVGGG